MPVITLIGNSRFYFEPLGGSHRVVFIVEYSYLEWGYEGEAPKQLYRIYRTETLGL